MEKIRKISWIYTIKNNSNWGFFVKHDKIFQINIEYN